MDLIIKNTANNTKSGNTLDSNPQRLFIICHGQIVKKKSPITAVFLSNLLFNNLYRRYNDKHPIIAIGSLNEISLFPKINKKGMSK